MSSGVIICEHCDFEHQPGPCPRCAVMDEATRAGWPDILVESIARGVDGVGLMLKGRNDVLYIKGLLFQSAEWAWVQLDDNQHDEAELWCSIGPFADCMNVRVSEIVCVLRERKS